MNLDLKCIEYDVDLENKENHKIAKRISDSWRNNCPDDAFYKNCIESICKELGETEGPVPDRVYAIWDIIERGD